LNRASPPPSVPTHMIPRLSCSTGPVLLLDRPSLVVYGIARPSRNWFNPCLVAAQRLPSRSSYNEYTVLCDKPSCGRKLSISLPRIRLNPFVVPASTLPSWVSVRVRIELSARPFATVRRSSRPACARISPSLVPIHTVPSAAHSIDWMVAAFGTGSARVTNREPFQVASCELSPAPALSVPSGATHAACTSGLDKPSAVPNTRTFPSVSSARPFGVHAHTWPCPSLN